MNNLALKYSKMIGEYSVFIQELMNQGKYPDEEFENSLKKLFFQKGQGCHRKQRGIIRISKFEFKDRKNQKEKILQIHPIEIKATDLNFQFVRNLSDDMKIWYVDFSDKNAFPDWGCNTWGESDSLLFSMPLLRKSVLFINQLNNPDFTDSVCYKDKSKKLWPTPILFEGVPVWASLINGKPELVQSDIKTNVISMMAPFSSVGEKYNRDQLIYLLQILLTAFGGIVHRAVKDKKKLIQLHTGNWGCGNLGNNKELIYLSQIYIASV